MFKIQADLAQAILNYLVTRPYAEVAPFVAALENLEPVGAEDQDLSPVAELPSIEDGEIIEE